MTRAGGAPKEGVGEVGEVVVVVPARDEAPHVPACLAALALAARRCPVPVRVVVVADRCTDTTAELAAAAGAEVVVSTAGRVGAARALGVTAGLTGSALPPQRVWIACTDADSLVPVDWLAHQVARARAGADLLLGTVALPGRTRHEVSWRDAYLGRVTDTHPHVHGANLGVRASRYLAAGGFPAVAVHEDRLLADAVRALPGARVVTTDEQPVLTSGRLVGRAPAGVAGDLRAARRRLATGDGAWADA